MTVVRGFPCRTRNRNDSLHLRWWPAVLSLLVLQPMFIQSAAASDNPVVFADVAAESGLAFQHHSPLSPDRHIHLTMGSGLGWLDYDRDGWPDLYCGQGSAWPAENHSELSDQLFRNRHSQFADVTAAAGIWNSEYAMGIAVGDANNDGFADLYVSCFGPNCLLLNNGDGTFSRQPAAIGIDHPGYGASCTWTDLDADGNLDLFVTNYVRIDRQDYRICHEDQAGQRLAVACPPWKYPGEADVVFRNTGDGGFVDVSQSAGLTAVTVAQGLGVVAADLDADGDQDVYVANDSVPNHLWQNNGDFTFTETGFLSGTALNRTGQREAGMGVAAGDVTGDGRIDLFVTNYYAETNTLYRNEGLGLFLDVTDESGMAAPSRNRLGFGTLMLDADNDADLDVLIVNGHVHDRLAELGQQIPYAQPAQLLLNQGRRFADVSTLAGSYFSEPRVGRGCAAADFDRDGAVDVAVLNLNGPAALLHNQTRHMTPQVWLELIGSSSVRDATGAVVEAETDRGPAVRLREGSSSYLSCSTGLVPLGLSDSGSLTSVTVTWPGGERESWSDCKPDQDGLLRLRQGTGIPAEPSVP